MSLVLFKTILFLLIINVISGEIFLEKYKLTPIDNIPKNILNGNSILTSTSSYLANCSEGAYQVSSGNCEYSEYLNINNQWYVFNDIIEKEDLIIDSKNNHLKCSDDKDCFTNKCQSDLCQINDNSPNKICSPYNNNPEGIVLTLSYKCYNITGKDEFSHHPEVDLKPTEVNNNSKNEDSFFGLIWEKFYDNIIGIFIAIILLSFLYWFYHFTTRKIQNTGDEAPAEIRVDNPNRNDDNEYDSDTTYYNDSR